MFAERLPRVGCFAVFESCGLEAGAPEMAVFELGGREAGGSRGQLSRRVVSRGRGHAEVAILEGCP